MSAVIIFELSDLSITKDIKDMLIEQGYASRWKSKDGDVIFLPNNAVWKKGSEQSQARTDFKNVISEYNSKNSEKTIKVESALFLSASPWSYFSNVKRD